MASERVELFGMVSERVCGGTMWERYCILVEEGSRVEPFDHCTHMFRPYAPDLKGGGSQLISPEGPMPIS